MVQRRSWIFVGAGRIVAVLRRRPSGTIVRLLNHDEIDAGPRPPSRQPPGDMQEWRPIELRWPRLSEQLFRVDKWSVCRGWAAMRIGSGVEEAWSGGGAVKARMRPATIVLLQ